MYFFFFTLMKIYVVEVLQNYNQPNHRVVCNASLMYILAKKWDHISVQFVADEDIIAAEKIKLFSVENKTLTPISSI